MRGPVPALQPGLRILLCPFHALDFRGHQPGDSLRGEEGSADGHQRQPPHSDTEVLHARAFSRPGLINDERPDIQTEERADVRALGDAHADREAC